MSTKASNIQQFFLYSFFTGSFALPLAYFLQNRRLQAAKPKKLQFSLTVVAEIGGAKSRFQLIEVDVAISKPKVLFSKKYTSNDFNSFSTIFQTFLQECKRYCKTHPDNAFLAISGPVKNNTAKVLNLKKWGILNGDDLAKKFKLKSLRLINDFEAIACSILKLQRTDYIQINEGVPGCENDKIAVHGLGNTLGYCSIIPAPYKNGIRYYVWGGEGGHAAFCPKDDLQCEFMLWLM